MYVLASPDAQTLQNWRGAFDESIAIVEVRTLDALMQCLGRLRPDALLCDLDIARHGLARVLDQMLSTRRDLKIIACGATDASENQELALFLAGARGYCARDIAPETLRQAVEAVLRGELWIRRALVPKLVDSLTAADDTCTGATGRFAILTPREIEIARLIGQGVSNKLIARQLAITERTVKAHLTTIFRKTGTEDRVKLALFVSRRH
jgi:two-component system NarL family response regulator